MLSLTRMPQPVIARVHGIATAAGCQLVSMCDLAVAADSAKFALPGVNVSVFCTTPAVGVARNVARKRTMEMLLTGETIDAATALAWGLVNRVVPAVELDAAVAHFTGIIGARSARVIAQGKRAFYAQIELGLAAAYDYAGGSDGMQRRSSPMRRKASTRSSASVRRSGAADARLVAKAGANRDNRRARGTARGAGRAWPTTSFSRRAGSPRSSRASSP